MNQDKPDPAGCDFGAIAGVAGVGGNVSDIDVAARAGAALARPVVPKRGADGAMPYVVVPDGYGVRSLADLFPDQPSRTRLTVALFDLPSFLTYVGRFIERSASLIYGQEDKLTVTAVIDHPHPKQPDWGEHRAIFTLRETREWAAWKAVNGKRFDQVAFAEFIENHLPDIAIPDGAALLEMVKQLDIRKAVAFESSVRLDNGQVQLTYVENISGSQAKSTATIPETFVLGMAPFEGAAMYRLTARLRYRLGDGKVALWFELLRPEDIVRDAWLGVLEGIAKAADVPVLNGVPPTVLA